MDKYTILTGLNTDPNKCEYCDEEAYVILKLQISAVGKEHKCESRFCSIRGPILESNKRLCAVCLNEKIPHDFTHFGKIIHLDNK